MGRVNLSKIGNIHKNEVDRLSTLCGGGEGVGVKVVYWWKLTINHE